MSDISLQFDASTLQKIYPYVVPGTWVEYAKPENVIAFPFSNDVQMVLVVDGHGTVRNVRPEDLDAVRTSREEAFEIAAANLSAAWKAGEFGLGTVELEDGTVIGGARGNWMAPAGALVLGNLHRELVDRFKQDEFAAIAVNQEFLVAFPTDERTLKSSSLRQTVEEAFSNHRKPLSKSWLLMDGNWPSEYPGIAAF